MKATTAVTAFFFDNDTIIDLCQNVFGLVNASELEDEDIHVPPTPFQVWVIGLAMMVLVSSCSIAGVILMPLRKYRLYKFTLVYFVGVGVGCLAGTAVFHLFPQAFRLESEESHEYLNKSWIWIAGIYIFYVIDRVLNLVIETKKSKQEKQATKYIPANEVKSSAALIASFAKNGNVAQKEMNIITPFDNDNAEESDSDNTNALLDIHPSGHAHDRLTSIAPIILAGDALHHLVDGMSIGAAFARSLIGGFNIGLAVFCEEFPRELGDVALLVTAGLSWKRALLYNLVSGMSGFLGFVIGALVGETSETAATYVFALAGGMFIYIALAIMLPEMREQLQKATFKSLPSAVRLFIVQNLGVLTGIILMYILAIFATMIEF